jgi:hypothetical protein
MDLEMNQILAFLVEHMAFLWRGARLRITGSEVTTHNGGDAVLVVESDLVRCRFVSDRRQVFLDFQPVAGAGRDWYSVDLIRRLFLGQRERSAVRPGWPPRDCGSGVSVGVSRAGSAVSRWPGWRAPPSESGGRERWEGGVDGLEGASFGGCDVVDDVDDRVAGRVAVGQAAGQVVAELADELAGGPKAVCPLGGRHGGEAVPGPGRVA